MSEFKIEKGIPIPEGKGTGRKIKYPFNKMEVGDSILCDKRSVLSAGNSWARRNFPERKFKSQKEGDKTRLWRVK